MSREKGSKIFGFLNFWHLLGETTRLDAWDLNFFFSDPDALEWSMIQLDFQKKTWLKGFFPQFTLFFWRIFRSLNRLVSTAGENNPSNKPVLFFGLTKNQIDSLSPVYEKTEDISWMMDGMRSKIWSRLVLTGYLCSLFFLPWAIRDYFSSNKTRRTGIQYNFAYQWYSYGLYFVIRYFLKTLNIKIIVLSNDHSLENRVLIRASKDEGKKTVYLQHASIPDHFPPLDVSYAFLEGFDALHQYERAGCSQTQVFLLGSPMFDKYSDMINVNKKMKNLGICVNILDSCKKVIELLNALAFTIENCNVYIRIHPRDKNRKFWEDYSRLKKYHYSDSQKEDIYVFLTKVDVIIAGNSNVHLDAVKLNVYPIFFNFSKNEKELYSFLKNNLVYYAKDITSICRRVSMLQKKKQSVRSRAKYYNDIIDTKHNGKSSIIASQIIREIMTFEKIIGSKWEKYRSSPIQSFRLPASTSIDIKKTDDENTNIDL